MSNEKPIAELLDEIDAFCATAAPPDYDPERVGDVPLRDFVKDAQVYLPRLVRELRERVEREQGKSDIARAIEWLERRCDNLKMFGVFYV